MDRDYDNTALAEALSVLGSGIQAQAMRPYKTSQQTVSQTTTTPVEFADMLARRNQIGSAREALGNALKQRENFGYSLASALSAMPQQQGYGSWLSDAARMFGTAFNARTNAAIDREQQLYDAYRKDLADALAYNQALGQVQGQTQTQTIGYTPYEYAGGTKQTTAGNKNAGQIGEFSLESAGKSVGYDPVKNMPDYGPFTRMAIDDKQLGLLKYFPGAQSVFKAITEDRTPDVTTLYGDVANIVSNKILGFVGKAGSVRVADTEEERQSILGPLANYQQMQPSELKAAIEQSRNNFVALGLQKAKAAGLDISAEDLKDYYNSSFTVPKSKATQDMYNIQDRPEQKQQTPNIEVQSDIPSDMKTKITMSVDLNSIKSGENSIMPGDIITFSDGSTATFKGDGSESDKQILEALQ